MGANRQDNKQTKSQNIFYIYLLSAPEVYGLSEKKTFIKDHDMLAVSLKNYIHVSNCLWYIALFNKGRRQKIGSFDVDHFFDVAPNVTARLLLIPSSTM